MKRKLTYAVILIALVAGYFTQPAGKGATASTPVQRPDNSNIEQAFRQHRSHIQVQGKATVIKVLPDDLKGIRHQRFLIRLGSGRTLLVVHNIDLAPRLPGLHKGSKIEFNGEYVWNEKGGLLHWTHRDPSGRHAGGWLHYNGKTYQ